MISVHGPPVEVDLWTVKFEASKLSLLLYQKLKVSGVVRSGVMIESFAPLRIMYRVPSFICDPVVPQLIELKVQFVGVVPSSKLSLIKYVCPQLVAAQARKKAKAAARPIADI